MTKTLDISAWPHLAEALKSLGEDEAVIFMQNGRKIVEVKPVEKESKEEKPRKGWTFGLSAGAVTYIADDFDVELPDSFWLGEA